MRKLDRPVAGIDKVTYSINPIFVNEEVFMKEKGQFSVISKNRNVKYIYLDPYNIFVVTKVGAFYEMTINQEGFIPAINYRNQIIWSLCMLYDLGILTVECGLIPAKWLIVTKPELFIIHINALEFYFDLWCNDIEILNPDAFNIVGNKNEGISYYSRDYKFRGREDKRNGNKLSSSNRNSSVIIYDKNALDRTNRMYSSEVLDKLKSSMRIEFKLYRTNTKWLNLGNLDGTYLQILNKHLDYLAMQFYRYLLDNVDVETRHNPLFRKIIDAVDEMENFVRFRPKELKSRENRKKIKCTADDVKLLEEKLINPKKRAAGTIKNMEKVEEKMKEKNVFLYGK